MGFGFQARAYPGTRETPKPSRLGRLGSQAQDAGPLEQMVQDTVPPVSNPGSPTNDL